MYKGTNHQGPWELPGGLQAGRTRSSGDWGSITARVVSADYGLWWGGVSTWTGRVPGWASDSVLMSSPLDFILQVQLFPLGKLVGLAGLVPFPPFALEVMSLNALERKWMERKPFSRVLSGLHLPFSRRLLYI